MIEQNKYYFYNIYLVCVEYKSGLWLYIRRMKIINFRTNFDSPKGFVEKNTKKSAVPGLTHTCPGVRLSRTGISSGRCTSVLAR